MQIGIDRHLPAVTTTPLHKQLVVGFLRHYGGHTLHTLIGASLIHERTGKLPCLDMECNNLFRSIGDRNVRNMNESQRFYTANSFDKVASGFVADFLTFDFTFVRHPEQNGSSVCIQEGTKRFHTPL